MVRPETVKLLIMYWMTYIEYGCSELLPEAYDGMAVVVQNTNNTTIRAILPVEKLSGSNFTSWYGNLRIVLRYEKKIKFVEQPTRPAHDPETADLDTIDKYYETVKLEQEVACLMLSSMSPDLQRALEKYNAYDMPKELKTMFEEQAKHELFKIVKAFHACVPKKAETPAVLAIREGKIQKDKKKLRGAKESRKLKHGALRLYMGNGMRATVEAIGSFDLILPTGVIILLDNCHFAPSVTRGVVSISCLVNNGYIHTFTNYGISVSKDTVIYFNAIPRDGIYEIDMHNLYPNVSSMFNVRNKRAKHALDSFYLWHCRLGHINKKRMDKLQRDGILQPAHDESLEKCKSCIYGKIMRKPFPHQMERAKDLLGLYTRMYVALLELCQERVLVTSSPLQMISAVMLTFSIWFQPRRLKGRLMKYGMRKLPRYPKEMMGYYFYYPLENKIFIARNAEFFENSLMGKRRSGVIGLLESRDLNEPPNYKAALSDLEFDKWLESMNTEMQSMKDNQVWILVMLSPNASGSSVAILFLYVDDILLMGNNVTMLQEVKSWLCKCFSMKDLGEATYVLGIKIIRDRSKRLIALSQSAYLEKTLMKFRMENSKKGYTPIIEKPDYRKSQGAKIHSEVQRMQRVPYASAIGSIMYAVRNTKDMVLMYGEKPKDELKVSCYADATVDWKSAKQSTTAMSSTEVEYIAVAEASMEAVWMRKFIDGLRNVVPSNK
ncbi:retrotransposon protein, putative, ty1-copia subclass [Tanacetum coccineum]